MIKTGDTIRHEPSGEEWLVAFVDGDRLAPCGWPFGLAEVKDCTLLESCSPEEQRKLVQQIWTCTNDYGGLDPRATAVRRLYPEMAP